MTPRNVRIIDPEAIRQNMAALRAITPASARMLAVVKADGYGHGAAETARAALAGGADMLAVAAVGEGEALRQASILEPPILVLGAVTAEDVERGVASGLTQTVCSPAMVRLCEAAAERLGLTARVHLKVDTGMGRIGVRTLEERDAVLQALRDCPHVSLTGAFTHFSDADGDEDGDQYTREQFQRFLQLTRDLPAGVIRHCANSAALDKFPEMALDMVRAGISLYGYPPVPSRAELRMCMTWLAKVSHVKTVEPGACVSYGRTFRADRPMVLATVTCGYADGYHRAASGQAQVLIRGRRLPVVGRICMDQMVVDATSLPDVRPEEPVVLMGRSGDQVISAEDIARWAGTISYEILTSSASRVERVYTSQEEIQP
jgi:alanine racemase